jgi:AAA15 family ATPase/GTPase
MEVVMRISKIIIENFKSLKNIIMENIPNLVVLIGANSSGKSNLLEALTLFFTELDPSLERNIGAINEHLWFDRNDKLPVVFEIGIEFNTREIMEILPKELSEEVTQSLGPLALDIKERITLLIRREIQGPASSAKWKTETIRLDELPIVLEGKFYTGNIEKNQSENVKKLFPEKTFITATTSGLILQNICNKLKDKFVYIPASRNVKSSFSGIGLRTPLIDPTTIGELTRLGQSLSESRKWNEFEEYFKKSSLDIEDLRVIESQVTIREKNRNIHFPVSVIGGGYQEILNLIHLIFKEKDKIFGIEEAELHLHPKLSRQFFKILNNVSDEKQIFLTTHSTIFIDQASLENTYILKIESNFTIINKIIKPKDLKNILFE